MTEHKDSKNAHVLLLNPETLDTGSLLFYLTLNNKSHNTRCTSREQILKNLEKYLNTGNEGNKGLLAILTYSTKSKKLIITLKEKILNNEHVEIYGLFNSEDILNEEINQGHIDKLVSGKYALHFKNNIDFYKSKNTEDLITLKDGPFLLGQMPTILDTVKWTEPMSPNYERNLEELIMGAPPVNDEETSQPKSGEVSPNASPSESENFSDKSNCTNKSATFWEDNKFVRRKKTPVSKKENIQLKAQQKLAQIKSRPNSTQLAKPTNEDSVDSNDKDNTYVKNGKKGYKLTSVLKLPHYDSSTVDLPAQFLERFLRTIEINLSTGDLSDLPVEHLKHIIAENIKQKDKAAKFMDKTKDATDIEELKTGFIESVSVPDQIKQKQFEAISSKPAGLTWSEFALSLINRFKNTYSTQDVLGYSWGK